jgi:hypothetical protein
VLDNDNVGVVDGARLHARHQRQTARLLYRSELIRQIGARNKGQ